MRGIGIINQTDFRKIHPAPSGIVSPSEVGVRKLIEAGSQKKGDTNGAIKIQGYENNDGKEQSNIDKQQQPHLYERDPKCINDHIKVNFEDMLGEPYGVRSPDCCWVRYHGCYTCFKNLVYTWSSILCGIPLAIVYGCLFAFKTISTVWILTPCFKSLHICCISASRFMRNCAMCIFGATCEECGELFWAFGSKGKKRQLMMGKRTIRVTFSDKIKTKRIPARTAEDKGRELTRFEIIRQMSWRLR